MKNRMFGSGLIFLAALCFLMSFTATAYDCETKGHSFQRQGYEEYNDEYHYIVYKCPYCDAIKKVEQEHYWYGERRFENNTNESHNVYTKCYYCDSIKKEERAHEWSVSVDSYEAHNDDYHFAIHKCCCGNVKKEQKSHSWSNDIQGYEQGDNEYHYTLYKCNDCGVIIKKQESHRWFEDDGGYEQANDDYHYWLLGRCRNCNAIRKEQREHSWVVDNYEKNNDELHDVIYKCKKCKREKIETNPHKWSYEKCIRKASLTQTGIIEKKCKNCNIEIQKEFSWSYDGDNCVCYDGIEHSPIYKNSTSVTVKLDRPAKGGVLRVTIGGKNYDTKLKEDSKKIKVKINKPKTGSKIKIVQLFKGKVIGQPSNIDYENYVYYAKKIKKGMKKNQVKYVYGWGKPDSTANASGGWSYWYYDDGSFVVFKKGKVKRWFFVS